MSTYCPILFSRTKTICLKLNTRQILRRLRQVELEHDTLLSSNFQQLIPLQLIKYKTLVYASAEQGSV